MLLTPFSFIWVFKIQIGYLRTSKYTELFIRIAYSEFSLAFCYATNSVPIAFLTINLVKYANMLTN